jgi:hypothetical protein
MAEENPEQLATVLTTFLASTTDPTRNRD